MDIKKVTDILYKLLGEQEELDIEYTLERKKEDETA